MTPIVCANADCGKEIQLKQQFVAQHDPATDTWKVWHPSHAPGELKDALRFELTPARVWVFTGSAAHRKQQAERQAQALEGKQ